MNKKMKGLQKLVHIFLYRIFMKNFLRIIFGISYKNVSHFRNSKQFIIVANHNSHMDTMSILSALPISQLARVYPVAAGDYFGRNKIAEFLSGFMVNMLLISRDKVTAKINPLEVMDKLLKDGSSILIFPEGSRGEAEVMQDFKHGTAILLKKNPGIPFIPVFLKGMGKALPKGDPFLLPMQCEVKIGEPIFINDVENKSIPEITETIRQKIVELNC